MQHPNQKKEQTPKIFDDFLIRERLFDVMDHPGNFSLISASSGFGKSTLVASWLQQQELTYSWINLAPADNQLLAFSNNVLTLLEPDFPEQVAALHDLLKRSEAPTDKEIITLILEFFQQYAPSVTLVLDDYHLIKQDSIHQLVVAMIEQENLFEKLIIVTRFDPPFPLVMWKQSSLMAELRAADLRFQPKETSKLLRDSIPDLDDELALRVEKELEGWIAGIKLLMFQVTSCSELVKRLDQLEDRSNSDFETLVNLYLRQLSSTTRDAVLTLSFFDTFSRELLEALGYGNDASAQLETIIGSHLLVVSVDKQGHVFQFHQLFHDSLRQHAKRELTPSLIEEKMLRGARYFESIESLEQAFRLYLDAKAPDEALRIFRSFRKLLIDANRWVTLERMNSQLATHLSGHPFIELTRCWLNIHKGQPAELFAKLEEMQATWSQGLNSAEEKKALYAEYMALRSYRTYNVEHNYNQTIKECEIALSDLESDWAYPKGYAWVFLLGALQVTGKLERAQELAREVVDGSSSPMEKAYVRLVMCYIYWLEADMDPLITVAEQLIRQGTEKGNKEMMAHGLHFKILHAYNIGNWGDALRWSLQKQRDLQYAIGVVRVFQQLVQASLRQLQGSNGWQDTIRSEIQRMYDRGDAFLPRYIKAQEAELELRAGDVSKAILIVDRIGLHPVMPVTNTSVEPNLAKANAYLATEDEEKWQEAKVLIDQLQTMLVQTHNRMVMIKVNLLLAGYHRRVGDESLAHDHLIKALETAVPAGIISPFFEVNDFIQELWLRAGDELPYQAFINDLKEQAKKVTVTTEISSREKDILTLIAQGLSNKEIGERLFISEKTVKNHSNRIFKKLRVKNRREAAHKALEMGVV